MVLFIKTLPKLRNCDKVCCNLRHVFSHNLKDFFHFFFISLEYSYLFFVFFQFSALSDVLDSLEEMQYLTDYFDSDCTFLDEIFEDKKIHSLLDVSSRLN